MGYLDTAGLSRFTAWVKARLAGKMDKEEADNTYLKRTGGTLEADSAFVIESPRESNGPLVAFSLDPREIDGDTTTNSAIISAGVPEMYDSEIHLNPEGVSVQSQSAIEETVSEVYVSGIHDDIHGTPIELSVQGLSDARKSSIQIDAGAIRQLIETGTGMQASVFLRADGFEVQLYDGTLLGFHDGVLELNGDQVVTQSQLDGTMSPYDYAAQAGYTGSEEEFQSVMSDPASVPYVDSAIQAAVAGLSGTPSGVIVMWSGVATAIPAGWVLCNGDNGTPDLRGRFVLGASDSHVMGETGGDEEVTLTVEQLPSHTHNVPFINNITAMGDYIQGKAYGTKVFAQTETAGNDKPHPNMPPYYVLAYIMKL